MNKKFLIISIIINIVLFYAFFVLTYLDTTWKETEIRSDGWIGGYNAGYREGKIYEQTTQRSYR